MIPAVYVCHAPLLVAVARVSRVRDGFWIDWRWPLKKAREG